MRWADEGTRFDQCHVQHPVCTPSRCSFMTGWYPHVRGHRTLWHLLRPDEPNLLCYLKRAGYTIHWYGKNDLLAPESFADSVDVAESRGGAKFGSNPFDFDDPRYYSFLYEPFDQPVDEHGDVRNVQAGIDFLHSHANTPDASPFLLYLPLTFPHCPYSAPQPWHDLIDPDDLPALRPQDLENRPDFHALIRQYRRLDQLDADERDSLLRKIQAVYLGMTGFVDSLLGRLLETLAETGLAENTTVDRLLRSRRLRWRLRPRRKVAERRGGCDHARAADRAHAGRGELVTWLTSRSSSVRYYGDDAGAGGRSSRAHPLCALARAAASRRIRRPRIAPSSAKAATRATSRTVSRA